MTALMVRHPALVSQPVGDGARIQTQASCLQNSDPLSAVAREPSPACAGSSRFLSVEEEGVAPHHPRDTLLGWGLGGAHHLQPASPQSTDSAFEHPHSATFSPSALPAREAPEVFP